jgi:hypothetical protein
MKAASGCRQSFATSSNASSEAALQIEEPRVFYGYARVLTDSQDLTGQLAQLNGCTPIFRENASRLNMTEICSPVDFRDGHRGSDGDARWSRQYLRPCFIFCLLDLERRQHPKLMLDGDRRRKNEFASEPHVTHLGTPALYNSARITFSPRKPVHYNGEPGSKDDKDRQDDCEAYCIVHFLSPWGLSVRCRRET